ncbi:hypothetical protein CORC01_08791 [Colletotrichum orchidophilum]|uniref:Uncharacterized protein n=1 Tax=Colletotrichum orchidophilum TaxID=1209926 RepID=A0A1G4B3D8_9PEZI|nr:uncharacterized protein CORC01_08791 [Colletotrichum orchidophilum]OHE95939.1 hypothetical protein CORC01_08791 [Colletotrichum orchidophilum]
MRLLRIQLTSCDQRSYLLSLALRHNSRSSLYCHHRARAGVLGSTKLLGNDVLATQSSSPCRTALASNRDQDGYLSTAVVASHPFGFAFSSSARYPHVPDGLHCRYPSFVPFCK